MAVEETTALHITCDNPDCPTKPPDLPPDDDRTGWLFVTHEVYGQPTDQHVFCSYACLSATSGDAAVTDSWGKP